MITAQGHTTYISHIYTVSDISSLLSELVDVCKNSRLPRRMYLLVDALSKYQLVGTYFSTK